MQCAKHTVHTTGGFITLPTVLDCPGGIGELVPGEPESTVRMHVYQIEVMINYI